MLGAQANNLFDIVDSLSGLLDVAIVTFASLAVFFFVWGIFQIMINLDNEDKRAEGRAFMIWSIIALVFIFGLWGFVELIQESLFF